MWTRTVSFVVIGVFAGGITHYLSDQIFGYVLFPIFAAIGSLKK